MTEVLRQRIEHLKLQGFSVRQISEMQNVSEREVRKLFNQDKVFSYENETEKDKWRGSLSVGKGLQD